MRPLSLDSFYFGRSPTYFFLSCSDQGTPYPPLAESVIRGFCCKERLHHLIYNFHHHFFIIAAFMVLVKIPNWRPWRLVSSEQFQHGSRKCSVLLPWLSLDLGGTVSKGSLCHDTFPLYPQSVCWGNVEVSFETEREVLGDFEHAFWSVGFLLFWGFGFFAGYQCEESVSLWRKITRAQHHFRNPLVTFPLLHTLTHHKTC